MTHFIEFPEKKRIDILHSPRSHSALFHFVVRPNRILLFVVLILLVFGCRTSKYTTIQHDSGIKMREYSAQSVLWQQLSGEYRALCYQAFNVAKWQLDFRISRAGQAGLPFAIITDIDETVLDNSSYNAKLILTDQNYTKEEWINWGKLEQAIPVPGSLEFMKYAHSLGVEVFYISNRYDSQKLETLNNLNKLGFPYADERHLFLRESESGKEWRRRNIAATHRILLLLGDNLSDFSSVFDDLSTENRNAVVDSLKQDFGQEFIVLPNPMYGDWENKGLYEGRYDWTRMQRDSIRKNKLAVY